MATPPLPPAGWYADPHGIADQRWWDGQTWTAHVHPSALTAAAHGASEIRPAAADSIESTPDSIPPYPQNRLVGKQEKKGREVMRWLLPGESVLYQFDANSTRPIATDVVVTDLRVFTYTGSKFGREVLNSDIAGI